MPNPVPVSDQWSRAASIAPRDVIHRFVGLARSLAGGPRGRGSLFVVAGLSDSERREFAASVVSFLEWVHGEAANGRERNEVAALVGDYLGEAGLGRSVVARSLPVFEHVNLQTAVNAWSVEAGRSVDVQGISIPPHYGPFSLQQVVTGGGMPPLQLCGRRSSISRTDLNRHWRVFSWPYCWSPTPPAGMSC